MSRSYGEVIDLFCGIGGFRYGLKQAGFDVAERCQFAFETNNQAPFMTQNVFEAIFHYF